MKVEKDRVVEIDYTLRGEDGQTIDSSDRSGPLVYLHGSGQIVPGLERALLGRGPGEAVQVSVPPEDAYGPRVEGRSVQVARNELPPDQAPELGMHFLGVDQDGEQQLFWVSAIKDDQVTLDANHPLAGKALHFNVQIRSVREATSEELDHGHVHGPEGHHH